MSEPKVADALDLTKQAETEEQSAVIDKETGRETGNETQSTANDKEKGKETEKEEPNSVNGKEKQKESSVSNEKPVDFDSPTGFRLRARLVHAAKCDSYLKNVQYIPLDKVEKHTQSFNSVRVGVKPTTHWATTGVIDKCFLQDDFGVTRLTDMRGAQTNLYITGKAFKKFENSLGMGSIVTIKRPFLLRPTELNQSIALHVDQVQQMWVVGLSLDLKRCAGYKAKDKQCDEWMDKRSGEFCNKHLERVYGFSKNSRMELAGGNSGFDIRWATKVRQADGTFVYQTTQKSAATTSSPNGSNKKIKEAYYVKGLGLVATDGSVIKQKLKPQGENPEERALLEELLKDKRDPGAVMLRKVKGIQDKVKKDVLSNEALSKMGMERKGLTREEEDAKKRSFEALKKASMDAPEENPSKKPKYVYLDL